MMGGQKDGSRKESSSLGNTQDLWSLFFSFLFFQWDLAELQLNHTGKTRCICVLEKEKRRRVGEGEREREIDKG